MTMRSEQSAAGPAMALLVMLLAGFTSCAGAEPDSSAAAQPAGGRIPDDRAGLFELGDARYPFLVVRCDLTGNAPDGMLVRGSGTAPDGRRMAVEVERLVDEPNVSERATVYFGRLLDGDHWSVSRFGRPGGRWFTEEVGNEAADGPLHQLTGSELVVTAPFRHSLQDTTRQGTLRARCPAR